MYLFYILSLFMVISGYVLSGSTSKDAHSVILDGKVSAAQMYLYHKAAVAQCRANPAYCNVQRVIPINNVKPFLPAVAKTAPGATDVYDSGDYMAMSVSGGIVVTHYRVKNANTTLTGFDESARAMVQELIRIAPVYWPAGKYDRPNQRLIGVSGKILSIPSTIDGYTFEDEVPMIASVWN
jgi:hypothetical protein